MTQFLQAKGDLKRNNILTRGPNQVKKKNVMKQ